LRVGRFDLPLHLAVLHLHAVEVAHVLSHLGQQLHPELLERPWRTRLHVAPDLISDAREACDYHGQETAAKPRPSPEHPAIGTVTIWVIGSKGCPSAAADASARATTPIRPGRGGWRPRWRR